MKAITTDFEYLPAVTVGEALDLLSQHKDDDYKIIAGGQSLNTMMKHRLITPEYIIDIKGISELDYIKYNDKDGLRIGALATHSSLERSEIVKEKYSILSELEENVASVETKNWGTVVGDLVNADPAADPAPPLIALDASLTIASKEETRTVSAEEFAVDFFETAVQPGELVTEIQIPALPKNTGVYFTKYSQLHGDYALASVAVLLTLDDKKETCVNARIGFGAVGSTPIRAVNAEAVLKGQKLTDELFVKAAEAATGEISPITGIEASADYKRELAGTLLKRVAKEALARAKNA
ncbi:MAG: xanthine dehydrogenase family protein subunit M [Acidobacteriota bacterium]|jgi:CO/xanthine dehydrogenase FAD-binding subunit|nr:xanthine dehydrogenase family protein subunit M [Acidobacteriota bacterium]